MSTKKILWIDDDINRFALMPYVDEFQDRGYDIDKVENPDEINNILEQNPIPDGIIVDLCMPMGIIVDVSMPTGKNIGYGEAKGGLQTGFVVLKRLMANPQLNNVKKIIFTIVDNPEVRRYCEENGIEYLEKRNFLSDTFVNKVEEIISKKE